MKDCQLVNLILIIFNYFLIYYFYFYLLLFYLFIFYLIFLIFLILQVVSQQKLISKGQDKREKPLGSEEECSLKSRVEKKKLELCMSTTGH